MVYEKRRILKKKQTPILVIWKLMETLLKRRISRIFVQDFSNLLK